MADKKGFFEKAKKVLIDFFGDAYDPAVEAENKRKQHEKIMQQKGMDEFLDAVKHAKSVNIELDKRYLIGILFYEGWGHLLCTMGKYTIRCGISGRHKDKQRKIYFDNVYVKEESMPILKLDKEVSDIVEKRIVELNPHDFEKCKKELREFDGKNIFGFSKKMKQK